MKKLLLASFNFTTGGIGYSSIRLVAVKSGKKTDLEYIKDAEKIFAKWFPKVHPESSLNHVIILPAITDDSTLPLVDNNVAESTPEDGYSADMSVDRIEQLIEETRPHTDRLVLNGWAPMKTIEYFQKLGHYINTIQDADNKDNYTIIKWG